MFTKRGIYLHEESLRKLLEVPENVQIVAVESSSNPISLRVVVAANDYNSWDPAPYNEDYLLGSETNVIPVDEDVRPKWRQSQ